MMATSVDALIGKFTATGATDNFVIKGDSPMEMSLNFGAGVATVEIQNFLNGEWETVQTYTTTSKEAVLYGSSGVKYRFECTAFTSGPIKFTLKK